MHSLPLRSSTPADSKPDGGLSPSLRRAFNMSQKAARHVLRRRFRVLALLKRAYVKLSAHSDAMEQVRNDFHTMLRMARAWSLRKYRTVPWKSMVYIVGAIVYFVNPADLIPDVLAGIGFVDDAAVAAAVVRALHEQLSAFREWENRTPIEGGTDLIAPEQETVAA